MVDQLINGKQMKTRKILSRKTVGYGLKTTSATMIIAKSSNDWASSNRVGLGSLEPKAYRRKSNAIARSKSLGCLVFPIEQITTERISDGLRSTLEIMSTEKTVNA